ncbi:hypothetical protein Hamer_G009520 [Homarus americanus]|uniref:Uncharacterized protein n=1 Tax=Homarus americanus TaxID=6706 RepID=A0A8J5N324_HOMAM|nr:hypothetical protein Hamer_G009520 [Homarus americanus]
MVRLAYDPPFALASINKLPVASPTPRGRLRNHGSVTLSAHSLDLDCHPLIDPPYTEQAYMAIY